MTEAGVRSKLECSCLALYSFIHQIFIEHQALCARDLALNRTDACPDGSYSD